MGTAGQSHVAGVAVTDTNAAAQQFYRLARTGSVRGPELLTQPEDQSPAAAETFWLEVAARGRPGPGYDWRFLASAGGRGADAPALRYQWFKDGAAVTNAGSLTGARSPRLVVTNAQAADAGQYWVVVTNAHGSVTSAVATVTISP